MTRPGRIEEETVLPSGARKVTTKDVNASYYANPMNAGSVSAEDIREAFFKEEMYKNFLQDGSVDEDVLGALTGGIQVNPRDVITGWIHAAAASNHRASLENVVNGKVGYLSGKKHSHLCSGTLPCSSALCVSLEACQLTNDVMTTVSRLHSMHSSNRQLDLTTLFTRASMENNLHRLYGLTALEAKDKILNEECHELAIKIMSTLLFSTIIARMTSRPWGPERWCERYSKKNNLGEPSVRQPFLPDCTPLESDNFLQYLMRTCTDKRGNTGRMTQWTGQGDASSIPPDLKYADMFCSFVKGIQTTMRSASELLVRLARDVHSGLVDQMGSRDLAVETLKVFIESHLMADKLKGSKFKSHQVRHLVSLSSVSLPLTITDFLSLALFSLYASRSRLTSRACCQEYLEIVMRL